MAICFKYRVEYGLLRVVSALVCVLPYRAALALGAGLAWIAFHVVRYRVGEAVRRIRSVLGEDVGARAARRIAWISMRNLFFNGIEILRFPRMTQAWVVRHVDTAGMAFVRANWNRDGGAILAVPHMGNWDLAGVGSNLMGLPVFFMARRQKNPLVDAYLNRLRGTTGAEIIHTDSGALRRVIRNLKAGKIFALLPDVRARESGVIVPFLGGQAVLATGMESFARHAGVPIFPACALREGWARHRWIVRAPVLPDVAVERESDQQRIMREVIARFDEFVRAHPEQYFWYNKRWILDPLDQNRLTARGRV
jgi:Kdo2-lipid IVA lauroyltransferase/acyltransferase